MSDRLAVPASRRPRPLVVAAIALAIAAAACSPRTAVAQAPTREMIDRGHRMLANVDKELRRYYFDSTYGGVDLDAHFRATRRSRSRLPILTSSPP